MATSTYYTLKPGSLKVAVPVFLAVFALGVWVPQLCTRCFELNLLLLVPLQIILTVAATGYFYDGLRLPEQIRTGLFILTITFAILFCNNILFCSFVLLPWGVLSFNPVSFLLANGAAVIATLPIYLIEKHKIEVDDSYKPERIWAKIPPIYVAGFIMFVVILSIFISPDYLHYRDLEVTVYYFALVQMALPLLATNFFFGSFELNKRARIYFTILALALAIGALENFMYSHFVPCIGFRIRANASDFITMNLGAVLTVVAYQKWKQFKKKAN